MVNVGASKLPTSVRSFERWIVWLVILASISELAFLVRLDRHFGASFLSSFSSVSQYLKVAAPYSKPSVETVALHNHSRKISSSGQSCVRLLEEQDALNYSRDFNKQPVLVLLNNTSGTKNCAVGCTFSLRVGHDVKADAAFAKYSVPGVPSILRSMESSAYYGMNDVNTARRMGYDIVMTTSLLSDVPVGYFSWSEYDIMAPLKKKTKVSLAAAFISKCRSNNFRLEALLELQKLGVTIDSYGLCHRNVFHGSVDKVRALKDYKFSLAFENSIEHDYVTEKFWQSLVAGSVPVVIGAPNIQDFVPASNSIIHIKDLEDVKSAATQIKYLASNETAYNETLRWKVDGPSDTFKALIDMSVVHSSCRLCIHIATKIRLQEEALPSHSKTRLCRCTENSETWHHLYVRERGRFEMESLYLRSSSLTMEALKEAIIEQFSSKHHVPIWKAERPRILKGDDSLNIFKVYPVGSTQRDALYTNQINSDEDLKKLVENNPCLKLEVIFV